MSFVDHQPLLPPSGPWNRRPWNPSPCPSPEHNPPGMIVLSPGWHTWQCPLCGKKQSIHVPGIRLYSNEGVQKKER